jgi:DNA (cytosine-5)-methyltransferase 1
MGQGRYVHPQRRRTITPHEAARLQTFPDWFDFGEKTPRGVLAKAIGNAVPPLLMVQLGRRIVGALELAVTATAQRKRA